MRLLLVSDRIFNCSSAYSKLSKDICLNLRDMGHKMAHLPIGYAKGMGEMDWEGIHIYPAGDNAFSEDVAAEYYNDWRADMLIFLKEVWVLSRLHSEALNFCPFGIIDHDPVSEQITSRLGTAFKVIAPSRFSQRQMRRNNIDSFYIPHWLNTEVWKPLDKAKCRKLFHHAEDEFIVGIVARNQARKMIPRQLQGYAKFLSDNPDIRNAHLRLWTNMNPSPPPPEMGMGVSDVGVNLIPEIMRLGLNKEPNEIRWFDPADYNKLTRKFGGLPEWTTEDEQNMVTLTNCFNVVMECMPPYEKIITCGGRYYFDRKRISHIKEGDQVLTHEGSLKKVIKTHKRWYKGELIEITPHYLPKFRVTPNHPILIREKNVSKRFSCVKDGPTLTSYKDGRFEWIPASQITLKHMLVAPKLAKVPIKRKESLTILRQYSKHPTRKDLPWHVRIDLDLAKLFGYFLAEGNATEDGVLFSVNPKKDTEMIEDIKKTIAEKFKLEVHERLDEENSLKLIIYSIRLSKLFSYSLGSNAHNKHLPRWLFHLKDEKKKIIPYLIRGMWDGDGSIQQLRKAEYTTASRRLANHLSLLLLKEGFISSVSYSKKRKAYRVRVFSKQLNKFLHYIKRSPSDNDDIKRKPYNRFRRGKNHFFIPIKSIKTIEYEGWVYNLEVEDDESYATPICLHNCTGGEAVGLTKLEGHAVGASAITTDYAGAPEYLGAGYTIPWTDYVVYDTPGVRRPLPDVDKIAEALTKLYNSDWEKNARRARRFAERFDTKTVFESYWKPFMSECEKEIYPKFTAEGASSWA